jgi:uncharacterized protein (DUF608 family)
MNYTYTGRKTKEISFPLGGIGTGSIGLGGNGSLIDWEILNRPNKRSINAFSHISIKAERNGQVMDARVLQGDLQPPYMGQSRRGAGSHSGYGFGPDIPTMAGLPHFRNVEFQGQFPIAVLRFSEPGFPGHVSMTAYNPFIPLNDRDSSIPGAFFEVELENTWGEELLYTVCLSTGNPSDDKQTLNSYERCRKEAGGTVHLLKLSSRLSDPGHPGHGDLCMATDAADISYQQYWYRGEWLDTLEMFWRDFGEPGKLANRVYTDHSSSDKVRKDMASLAAHVAVGPGGKRKVRFVICWSFPNVHNFWNPEQEGTTFWNNYYNTLFSDSTASAKYALEHWQRLYGETLAFKNALFESTLPEVVKEAVSANLSVLKTPTTLRLADGSFYGFEGCLEDEGSCEGSCTHVWNYAYALPFLFPRLERSMRDLDYRYNQRWDGKMSFRLMLPPGREASQFRACADGQFGGVIKMYRDWKISGDTEWLRTHWEAIKQSIAFAWAKTNEDRWDPEQTGVLTGRLHHTLDMELFGPSSWLNGFYLGALQAGARMARHLGETDTAELYERLFRSGKAWTDGHLFNGEFYGHRIDLSDKSILLTFGEEAVRRYWHEERHEIKYQIGQGCAIDQVVAQWHANLCGLGELFDREQTITALKALYRFNYKPSLRNEANTWRLFALNDEAGMVICSWPEGAYKPYVPVPYATEMMTGMEYQAASHMIQEGLVEEGVSIVQSIRDRYDGEKRNPWNEMECGSNYARSMASYSLLNAFGGFQFDAVRGMIGFHPVRLSEGRFQTFWSLGSGWGTFEMSDTCATLRLLGGGLGLLSFALPLERLRRVRSVSIGGLSIGFQVGGSVIQFNEEAFIGTQQALVLHFHTN